MLIQIYLGKHDIVLLNGIPIDIPVVAGIITNEFQTPLSHINILSSNRDTPNMALKNAWTNSVLNSYIGKLVHLEVLSNEYKINEATIEQAEEFWNKTEPKEIINLELNTELKGLFDIKDVNLNNVSVVGGKAAGLDVVWVSIRGRTLEEEFKRYSTDVKPDLIITEIAELKNFI